jgi:hypothetical protein
VTLPGAFGALVHAGVSAALTSGAPPSPASRPASKAGTTHAMYSVFSVSNRGDSRRETDSSGRVASTSRSASSVASFSQPSCACAHAHESTRFGSSCDGTAGAPISSTGKSSVRGGRSRTPSCLRTTTSTIHGRTRP